MKIPKLLILLYSPLQKIDMDILIKGAKVITQNNNRDNFETDILIEKNKIVKVGKELSKKGVENVFSAKGKIIFPGLVNAHTHVAMGLLRSYGEGLPLHRWLTEKIWPAEEKMTKEDLYWGAQLGILEMIRSGTTCFGEMYISGIKRIADAVKDTGIRAVIGKGAYDGSEERSAEKEIKEQERTIHEIRGINSRVQASVAAHAPYSCSEELLVGAKELANKENLLFHMHVSETRKEVFELLEKVGMRPVEYLEKLGLVDNNSLFAHMGWITKREIEISAKNKLNVAHCPVSNLKLATGGISPVAELDESGANITYGTDGSASNNSLNLLETMKTALLFQSHKYWDPERYPQSKAWDSATINGAKALGINAGSICEGKLADLVFIDAKAANILPLHNDLRSIIYSINPSNITEVMIDGKFVMQDRQIVGIDEEKVLKKASDTAHELINR